MAIRTPQMEKFQEALRALYVQGGSPPYRTITTECGVSNNWPSRAFHGRYLVQWDLAEKLVKYLDGDLAHYKKLWDEASISRAPDGYKARSSTPPLTAAEQARMRHTATATDACLIALEDGRVPADADLHSLPTWRRELLISIGVQLGCYPIED